MLMQNKGSNLPTKIAILAIALAAVLYLKHCVQSGALPTDEQTIVEPSEAPQEPAAEMPSLPDEQAAPTDQTNPETAPSNTAPAP